MENPRIKQTFEQEGFPGNCRFYTGWNWNFGDVYKGNHIISYGLNLSIKDSKSSSHFYCNAPRMLVSIASHSRLLFPDALTFTNANTHPLVHTFYRGPSYHQYLRSKNALEIHPQELGQVVNFTQTESITCPEHRRALEESFTIADKIQTIILSLASHGGLPFIIPESPNNLFQLRFEKIINIAISSGLIIPKSSIMPLEDYDPTPLSEKLKKNPLRISICSR